MNEIADLLKDAIRDVPDFPKKGIIFKDITPLLQDPAVFQKTLEALYNILKNKKIDKIVGIESRGFIFGAPLAYMLKRGFIPIRKKGKLPYKTVSVTYDLEYGSDTLEMHADAIKKGESVVIIDDLLATGGTVGAASKLVQNQGAEISCVAFIVELMFLKGREKLKGFDILSLIQY